MYVCSLLGVDGSVSGTSTVKVPSRHVLELLTVCHHQVMLVHVVVIVVVVMHEYCLWLQGKLKLLGILQRQML